METDIRRVEVVGVGESKQAPVCNVLGDMVSIKVNAIDTGGAYAIVECINRPGGGTPPHVHQRECEAFYIIEGEVEFWTTDSTIVATAGMTVYGPKGVPHCYKNIGKTDSRMLTVIHPAGMEKMFEEINDVCRDDPADIQGVVMICARYGVEILPLPPEG